LSENEKDKIFGGTATSFYRLNAPDKNRLRLPKPEIEHATLWLEKG
jgi:hypothetical protein